MKRIWLEEQDLFRGFAILGVIAIHAFTLPPPPILKYYSGYQFSPLTDQAGQIIITLTPSFTNQQ